MAFTSVNFVVLTLFLLAVYWALPRSLRLPWLLLASAAVYLGAGWVDLCLLLAAVAANWIFYRLTAARRDRRAVAVAVVGNLSLLGWYKYRHFFGGWFGLPAADALVIPLGISFYVFQLISFQVEAARGLIPERLPPTTLLQYVLFFPHHQAGPIMRPHSFLSRFAEGRRWSTPRFLVGVDIALWGLFKKVWIADFLLRPHVNSLFSGLEASHGLDGNAWLLAALYGLQIYADFSGYSDLAVGLGRMFGFKLDRNFHQPYLASGPAEFWKRWHVTLSAWLQDHLYIPLAVFLMAHVDAAGALEVAITVMTLAVVMLLGGLWHGAAWAFVVWGGLHGLLLMLEHAGAPWLDPRPRLKRAAFLLLIFLIWLPFRESDLGVLWRLVSRLSAWTTGIPTLAAVVVGTGAVALNLLEDAVERRFPAFVRRQCRWPLPLIAAGAGAAGYLILCGITETTMFIYQRF
jgi:alginate O-acetyltransferase complex protein AlgI